MKRAPIAAALVLLASASACASDASRDDAPGGEGPVSRLASPLWTIGPNMGTPRFLHAVAPIEAKKFLVVGGADRIEGTNMNPISSCEIYDATAGKFVAAPPMLAARVLHTATPLLDGRVLVAGGARGLASGLTTAEIYDPTKGTWTPAARLRELTAAHTAVRLSDGRVLVSGGISRYENEIYDPAANTWSLGTRMTDYRYMHTATMLDDGRILLAGGSGANPTDFFAPSLSTAETYDPATDTTTKVGTMTSSRVGHSATKLKDGRVLLVGGSTSSIFVGARVKTAEIFDPKTNLFTKVADNPQGRALHVTTLLPSGGVLVAAGSSGALIGGGHVSTSEVYDAAADKWRSLGLLIDGRTAPVGFQVPDGPFVVSGGYDGVAVASTDLLTALPNGSKCTSGNACESGYCTDDVCCATRCLGPCEGCSATGVCEGVVGEPKAGHSTCGGYACASGSPPKCRETCTTKADCARDFLCKDGECVANDAPKCSADHSASVSTVGKVAFPCGAYLCDDGDGKCRTTCRGTADCATGFVCRTEEGACVPSASLTGASSGCAVAGNGVPSGRGEDAGSRLGVALFGLAGWIATRRGRRATLRR